MAAFDAESEADGFGVVCYILDVDLPGPTDHAVNVLSSMGLIDADGSPEEARRFFGDFAEDNIYLAGWCDGAMEARSRRGSA